MNLTTTGNVVFVHRFCLDAQSDNAALKAPAGDIDIAYAGRGVLAFAEDSDSHDTSEYPSGLAW